MSSIVRCGRPSVLQMDEFSNYSECKDPFSAEIDYSYLVDGSKSPHGTNRRACRDILDSNTPRSPGLSKLQVSLGLL